MISNFYRVPFNFVFVSETSSFHHNEYLETILFPKLDDLHTLDGQVEFTDNPKLKELHFPVLTVLFLFGERGGKNFTKTTDILIFFR